MTKQQELKILDKAIAELGAQSYLGPWLAEVRAEVEREITSDCMPTPTLRETREQCNRLVEQQEQARQTADARAEVRIELAKAKYRNILDQAASSLRDALRRLTE